jgi:hypothetical protein
VTPERLEQARAELLDFESQHPRSREHVQESCGELAQERRECDGSQLERDGLVRGSFHAPQIGQAIVAFVVQSEEFGAWLREQADDGSLLPRKKRDAELKRLERAGREADTAIVRERLEREKRAAETKLAELAQGAIE